MTDFTPAQSQRQASVRSYTNTDFTYEGDWLALFEQDGVTGATADGAEFDGLLTAWCNLILGASYNNTIEAANAFAQTFGAENFGVLGTFTRTKTLAITGSPVLTATQDIAYTGFTVTANGGAKPYTFSLHAGTFPAGIDFAALTSGSKSVAGIPTVAGAEAGLVIRVTDAAMATADLASFTLTVAAPVEISGTPITVGVQNVPYAGFTVTGSEGTAPLVYSIHAGSLPTGITLDTDTGEVAGTPTIVETKTGIVIRVTDIYGSFADLAAFQISVS